MFLIQLTTKNFSLSAIAQVHYFSNAKVNDQVSKGFLTVYSHGLLDYKWEKVNPNTPVKQSFVLKFHGILK